MEACGGLWRVLEGCGGLLKVVEGCGGLWRAVEGCGGVWRGVEWCGGLWDNFGALLMNGAGSSCLFGVHSSTAVEMESIPNN